MAGPSFQQIRPDLQQKQPDIASKLLKELPGIFNWAFAGLRCLREQGAFTETVDQATMTREMIAMANPLVAFVEDVVGNGAPHWSERLNKKEVYQKYTEWCKETNTLPMSARTFWPRLRQVFPYRETRTSYDRFIEFEQPRKYCGDKGVEQTSDLLQCGDKCG